MGVGSEYSSSFKAFIIGSIIANSSNCISFFCFVPLLKYFTDILPGDY
jgi:hypothetical protein